LKIGDFKPEFAGKLNFYVNTVNGQLKGGEDQPTIGVLLCKTPNETVIQYSLQGIESPIGVANYELAQALPKELKGEIPTIEELEAEIEKGIEELKTPSQTRLDALKDQLEKLKREETKTTSTHEILCGIFDQSLIPLFSALLHSFKELETLFMSNEYYWTGPNNIIDLEQLAKHWKDENFLKNNHTYGFHYRLRGLKKAGSDAFDVYLDLKYYLDTYNYNFSITNRNNNEQFVRKQYHEQLTQEDIQTIIEISRGYLIEQIEHGLERLKK
jgi:hypothetical protein